jgi:DNA-binding response OmpR family regulator
MPTILGVHLADLLDNQPESRTEYNVTCQGTNRRDAMPKVLIIEDESDLAGPIQDWLTRENYTVEVVNEGNEALSRLKLFKYDVIVLDLMLPGIGGMEICQRYRSTGGNPPILMLTAKSSVEDKEAGLDAGADDYLTKPFHLKELSARLRAMLRRPAPATGKVLKLGNLSLDPTQGRATKDGQEIHLVPKEFSLLEFLMRHPNQVFSAEALLDRVWASDTLASPDTVRTHIKTLRRKIDTEGQPSWISTVHGLGYRIDAP